MKKNCKGFPSETKIEKNCKGFPYRLKDKNIVKDIVHTFRYNDTYQVLRRYLNCKKREEDEKYKLIMIKIERITNSIIRVRKRHLNDHDKVDK